MIVVLVAWVLALARTVVNLALVPRLRHRVPVRFPLVSVIIPARNEERMIERTVRAFLAQTYAPLEIIVVDDRSTDSTPAILEGLRDMRLVVVTAEEPPPGWLGKPHALHVGSQLAQGELLLFVDADVLYAPDAVAASVAQIEERAVPMLTLFPRIEMKGFWEHVLMPNLAVFAFTFAPLWLVNRTVLPLFAIGGGSGNLVRRSDYEAVGGHGKLSDAVVDDVALSRLMRRNGRRTEVVLADEHVSVRMYHGLAEIVSGFTKNTFAAFGRSYLNALLVFSGAVVFHLLPYALLVTGNTLAIATVAVIALARLILFSVLRYRPDNALLAHPLMVGMWLFILARSVWLTGFRRRLVWRGRTYDSRSTRFGAD